MTEKKDDLLTVAKVAYLTSVSRQSIYIALRNKKLKSTIIQGCHRISRKDVKEYEENKYSREMTTHNGELVFDKSKGLYSVNEVAHIMKIPIQRVYFDLRIKRLPFDRKGYHYVINENVFDDYRVTLTNHYKRRNDKLNGINQ